ncbi:hypothetical protein RE428_49210 (plasmid) [Marinobacter nanhaiticus D15-8W]|nr:hypothetical protein RE428_49210 [Marinobacter nanhaiticus D15-8W]
MDIKLVPARPFDIPLFADSPFKAMPRLTLSTSPKELLARSEGAIDNSPSPGAGTALPPRLDL